MSQGVLHAARQVAKRVWYFGGRYSCPVCNANTRKRHTFSYDFEVLKRLDVVGGEYVEADDCPICFANQRIRLLYAILIQSGVPKPGSRVLHVAPERALYENLFQKLDIDYVPADLFPARYPYIPGVRQADITDLPFESGSFDLILCNHVLEHVPDDLAAMRELRRVLKPGGLALLQVPVATRLDKTVEDPAAATPEEREARFGQFDHIRIYTGADYLERLTASGFKVQALNPSDLLSAEQLDRFQLNPREQLFMASAEEISPQAA
jgi:hypothetical protein